MQIFLERQGALVCFCILSVIFVAAGFNYGDHRTVEVVGLGECADCRQRNIKTRHAFAGLHVTVDCRSRNGGFKTRGAGELDESGSFKVSLPQEIVEDGELKEECYAHLHSASAAPCPAYGGLDHSKIVPKSISDDKHTLEPSAGKLRFSTSLCPSAFFWHFFKHPDFPFPPKDKENPPMPNPPKEPQPRPPQVPVYKKPPAAPVPTYKKPPTTSTPTKKPCPPKEKTPSTPTPVYKPLPPPTPISKPPPTTSPPFFNFFPPFPFKKKPCPPNYFFNHPWFGHWPPSHS